MTALSPPSSQVTVSSGRGLMYVPRSTADCFARKNSSGTAIKIRMPSATANAMRSSRRFLRLWALDSVSTPESNASHSCGSGSAARSPANSSPMVKPSAAASGSTSETSGKPMPRSHLETVVSETCSVTASSFCVSPFSLRTEAMSAPVFSYCFMVPSVSCRPDIRPGAIHLAPSIRANALFGNRRCVELSKTARNPGKTGM